MDVGATVTHQNVLTVLMTCVTIVAVRMTIFKHEDLVLDLSNTSKGKLYKSGQLIFVGDGYRCITMMMRNCKDYKPVQKQFKPQLTMREQCRLTMKKDK